MDNVYKNLLISIVKNLKDILEKEHQSQSGRQKDDFTNGEIFGLYWALDLVKSQAEAFQVSSKDLGFDHYNLEQFLMNAKGNSITKGDFVIFNNALNEICNGPDAIDPIEFHTRVGCTLEEANALLEKLKQVC